METEQLENLINELEQNSDRLRALYDQYFMGIEKTEPAVLKKTVERQIYVLRREQIRNTGLRFKLNTIIQRLNTYQQYWMRICREIENGTYKRDLRRAAKRFGEDAVVSNASKLRGKLLSNEEKAEQQANVSKRASHEDEFEVDVDMDVDEASSEADRGPRSALDELSLEDDLELGPPKKKNVGPIALTNLRWSLDDLDNVDDFGPPPPKDESPVPQAPRRQPEPVAPPPQKQRWTLDDLDNVDDFGPPPPPKAEPKASVETHARQSDPVFSLASPAPAHERAAQQQPLPSRSAPVAVQRTIPSPIAAQPQRAHSPMTPVRQPPGQPAPHAAPLPQRHAPVVPQRQAPQATATPVRQAPVATTPVQRAPVATPPAERPEAASAQRTPAVAAQPPQRPAATPAETGPLSDARVRQIYDKYVQAKRECKESTSGITADTLATSLRDSAKKLGAKHTGKQVDFDVVIKDGKAVLKPVVKG